MRPNNVQFAIMQENLVIVESPAKAKTIEEVKTYFSDVLEHKRIIPFTKYTNGVGRKAQATEFKKTQGAWPEKSVKYLLTLV